MKMLNWIKENKILVLFLVIGAAFRLYKLDYQSMWVDEICSFKEAHPSMSVIEIYQFVKNYDQHPPLYYTSLHFVFLIFGHTTFVMRAYSAVLGIAGLVAFYFLGKEIANKKIALIGVALLAFNHFHIFYSQEARMYSMVFLTSTLSFYALVRFIKKATIKTAAMYAIFSTLMIYSHFFALFALFAQTMILLYFLIEKQKEERKRFLILSLLAGIAIFILWIPAMLIFLMASKTQNFWIQPPSPEQFSMLFKDFFGTAEVIVYFISVFIIFYFIRTFNKFNKNGDSTENNKHRFRFVVIAIWVFVTLLVPYIISYIKIPVMVNRYFMTLLPAIILLAALGVYQIKDIKLRNVVIGLFLIASFTDIVIAKDYYNKITKTQFREITNDIIKKDKNKTLVVTTWAWHMNTFLEMHKIKTHESDLQTYVNKLMLNPKEKVDFWFIGGHFQLYQLSADAEAFLNANFNKIDQLEYYDTWARHYVKKAGLEDTKILSINEFTPIKSEDNIAILLFSNSTTNSKPQVLEPGNYRVAVKAKSLPDPPIAGENANVAVAVDGKEIGACFASEKEDKTYYFSFAVKTKKEVTISLTFGNDMVLNDKDRNVLIYSVIIEKVKN